MEKINKKSQSRSKPCKKIIFFYIYSFVFFSCCCFLGVGNLKYTYNLLYMPLLNLAFQFFLFSFSFFFSCFFSLLCFHCIIPPVGTLLQFCFPVCALVSFVFNMWISYLVSFVGWINPLYIFFLHCFCFVYGCICIVYILLFQLLFV